MNLLLLLSALLSAITGVNVGNGRAPVAAEQVARAAAATAAATDAVRPVHFSAQAVDAGASRQVVVRLVRFPVATPPLYASRRRE